MISTHFKMALQAIRTARWRSFLTMLGVVVGVSSVLTIVSIGQGVKRQISHHVAVAGAEVVTVRPGRLVERDQRGRVTKVNYQSVVAAGSLTEQDLSVLQQSKQAAKVVPFGLMSGAPQVDSTSVPRAVVIGTSPDVLQVLQRKLAFGSFFNENDTYAPAGVIGPKLAEELFKENAPIGRTLNTPRPGSYNPWRFTVCPAQSGRSRHRLQLCPVFAIRIRQKSRRQPAADLPSTSPACTWSWPRKPRSSLSAALQQSSWWPGRLHGATSSRQRCNCQ